MWRTVSQAHHVDDFITRDRSRACQGRQIHSASLDVSSGNWRATGHTVMIHGVQGVCSRIRSGNIKHRGERMRPQKLFTQHGPIGQTLGHMLYTHHFIHKRIHRIHHWRLCTWPAKQDNRACLSVSNMLKHGEDGALAADLPKPKKWHVHEGACSMKALLVAKQFMWQPAWGNPNTIPWV